MGLETILLFQVDIRFVGNKARSYTVDEKNWKYLSQIGLYERCDGFVGFADVDFAFYVYPLRLIEGIELREKNA